MFEGLGDTTELIDFIDGRLAGLRILLYTPSHEKTMTNRELEYAIQEIEIIRKCII